MSTRWRWSSAAQTHRGMRREINEDAIMSRAEDGFWVVADGMGGHEAGDVASTMVTEAMAALATDGSLAEFVDRVDDTFTGMNTRLREHSEAHFQGRTMGCTVVSMVSRGEAGVCLWAGDSRLYRLRDGELRQVSRDHSPLEELVEQGVLSAEEAEEHPDSNVITRAVGGQAELFMDIALFDIIAGDTFLLCSDGLYREVKHDEIGALMAGSDLDAAVQGLLDLALERGARDNVSIILVRPEPAD